MIKRIKLLLAIFGLISLFVFAGGNVQAVDVLQTGCTVGQANSSEACRDNRGQAPGNNQIYGPNGVLTKVARLFSYAVGAVSIIFIIIGGFKYVQSFGDPNNVKSAKETVFFAIVGLLVAAVAQAIVVFVVSRLGT
jgi:hypothetical protein